MRQRLIDQLAFRAYDDFAVLVDHRRGELLKLNASAGELLGRLDRGKEPATDGEARFVADLVARGLVASASPAIDAGAAAAEPAAVAPPQRDELLERINREAAAARIPLHCQLEISYRCSLECRHCYLGDLRRGDAAELALEERLALVDDLAELGALFLTLTGGEPLTHPHFRPVFDRARDRRFAVSVLTSGWGADRELFAHLARRGLDGIQVSLYGPDAAIHDGFTGVPGSFDAALAAMRALRDLEQPVRAGVTVTTANYEALERIRALLRTEEIPAALGLYLEPRRDGSTAPQRLALAPDQLRRAFELFPPTAVPRMAGRRDDDPVCGAGANALALDPAGTVYPCLSLRRPAGSIREQRLSAIWSSAPVLEELRALRVADLEECPSCELRASCNRCGAFAVAEGLAFVQHSSFDCEQARVIDLVRADSNR